MLIFGWGRRTRNVEATLARQCTSCARSEMFRLERVRTWFTLFFIPVFPYETQYWLLCTECRCGIKVSHEEYAQIIADLASEGTQGTYMTLTRT